GLPVVSTPIPEVEVLGHCRIAAGADAFVRQIRAALESPGPDPARSEAFRGQSWETRLGEIRKHVAAAERSGTRGAGIGPPESPPPRRGGRQGLTERASVSQVR